MTHADAATEMESAVLSHINDIAAENEEAVSVEEFDPTLSMTDDIGLESLDLAELAVRLEDDYGVDVFEDDVVDELAEVIEALETHE